MISKKQLGILRHALGWPKNYRNHFCTGKGSDDYDDCEKLVAMGLMICSKVDWLPDDLYRVTVEGRNLVEKEIKSALELKKPARNILTAK